MHEDVIYFECQLFALCFFVLYVHVMCILVCVILQCGMLVLCMCCVWLCTNQKPIVHVLYARLLWLQGPSRCYIAVKRIFPTFDKRAMNLELLLIVCKTIFVHVYGFSVRHFGILS